MRVFLVKLFLLGITVLLCLNFLIAPLLIGLSNRVEFFPWSYIYARVINSSKKQSHKKIILGDSVGNQLYQASLNSNSYTTNGSVLIAGNFMILQNYLRHNPKPDTLIIIYNPVSFSNDFYGKLVYNSFCKPFNTSANTPYILPELDSLLKSNYKYRLTRLPFFKILNCIEDPTVPDNISSAQSAISNINLIYLKELDTLVRQKGIYCRFVSPALNKSLNFSEEKAEEIKRQVDAIGCSYLFSNYWKSVRYLDSNCFSDELHYSKTYLSGNLSQEQKLIESFF